jgi:hypothetical protein
MRRILWQGVLRKLGELFGNMTSLVKLWWRTMAAQTRLELSLSAKERA